MLTTRAILGLVVSERRITVAEVSSARERASLSRVSEFLMPAQGEPRDWAQIGKALKAFLKQEHFSASRCVIGLKAGWLIARGKPIPPGARAEIAGILSIAAERDFPTTADEYAFDFVPPGRSDAPFALLLGVSRRRLDEMKALAAAAGLSLISITSSTLELADQTVATASAERLVLHLGADSSELAVQSPDGPRAIRGFAAATEDRREQLAADIHRAVSMLPALAASDEGRELLVWDAADVGDSWLDALAARLNVSVKRCVLPDDLGLIVAGDAPASALFAEATAIAMKALSHSGPAVDFANSKLTPKRKGMFRQRMGLGIAAGLAVVAAMLFFALDWRSDLRDVAAMQTQLDEMKDAVADARGVVEHAGYARGWYDRRPSTLLCLREITLLFPEEGVIWATGITIRDGRQVMLAGKCRSERVALEIMDKLKASPAFEEVKSLYVRQAPGGSRDVSFAVSFNFAGAR